MTELKDTVALMLSDDYVDRFRAEHEQVRIRAGKLESMLTAWRKGVLNFTPDCSYALLNSQLMTMKAYLSILNERADVEGVRLC